MIHFFIFLENDLLRFRFFSYLVTMGHIGHRSDHSTFIENSGYKCNKWTIGIKLELAHVKGHARP